MTDRRGWGMVGTGHRAREVMIPALMASPRSRVVGVCSREEERAREAVGSWTDLEVYPGLGAMLSDPAVEVVYIASPHFLHVPQAAQAIDANKHVFMESPMALSVDGAHKLVEKARSKGVVLGVASQYRFHSSIRSLHQKIREGQLGEIKHICVHCAEPLTWNQGWWCDESRSGPATLLRLGVHALDLVAWLRPEPMVEVMAMGVEEGEDQINTLISVLMRFQNGSLGYVMGASGFKEPTYFLQVEGTEAAVIIQGDFAGQGSVTMVETRNGREKMSKLEPEDPVGTMIDEFARALAHEQEYRPDGIEGKRIVEITCAVIESMKSKRAVKAGEILRLT